MRGKRIIAAAAIALTIGACGGGNGGSSGSSGQGLFEEKVLEGHAGCVTCHSREPGEVLTGPSLAAIGADAASRVSGMAASAYLEESILDPDAFVVDGFDDGLMPQVWGDVLDDSQVSALVDYLLTLQG
jgi:hypothetical protein